MPNKKVFLFTIVIAVAGIMLMLLLLFPKAQKIRKESGEISKYSEDMATFRWSIFEYLDAYYNKNKRYPNNIDVNTFDTFGNPDYTKIFRKVIYHADANSYEITFSYPDPQDVNGKEIVIIEHGLNGKRANPNCYVIDKKTGKHILE